MRAAARIVGIPIDKILFRQAGPCPEETGHGFCGGSGINDGREQKGAPLPGCVAAVYESGERSYQGCA